jgi:hypothetical protein
MAKRGNSGDKNSDGIDDDFDGRPGNSYESPSYSRIYDSLGKQETSNLGETSLYFRSLQNDKNNVRSRNAALKDRNNAQASVFFKYDFGKFIIPKEKTWAAHAEIVCDNTTQLFFSPARYPIFDKIIAERCNLPALYDPTNADYPKYEGLRTNLEVLRNDIIGHYLNDGTFDPGDERFIPHIKAIAEVIGDAISADRFGRRMLAPAISIDVANVEGVGAAEIYKFLLNQQYKHAGAFDVFLQNVRNLAGLPNRNWNLPPLEHSPFSPEALSAPPPRIEGAGTPGTSHNASTAQQAAREVAQTMTTNSSATAAAAATVAADRPLDLMDSLVSASHRMLGAAHALRSPETLNQPTKDESVEEARKILRWFKNLQGTDMDMEQWMRIGTLPEQEAKAHALTRLVEIYQGQLSSALTNNTGVGNHYLVESASHAAGSLAESVALHTLESLPEGHPALPKLDAALDNLPPEWEARQTQPVGRLVEALESAMSHMTSKPLSDRSPIDRILEISENIALTARKLRGVDTLEEPAREESIELAREILRRLKSLSFSDKPVHEALDAGRPNEKLAFAQKLGEMVDVYKNMLLEAAAFNPAILQDQRIKDATDAVDDCANSLKLMATKEIPNSMAASQQISSDIAKDPEAWNRLNGHTVSRLVGTMEQAVERAHNDIAQNQERQHKQEQDAASQRANLEAAAAQSQAQQAAPGQRRPRRRRRNTQPAAGGLTKTAARRNANDLDGDGVLDSLQGKGPNAPRPPAEGAGVSAPSSNLSGVDLRAIRELGGTLKQLNQQAAELAATQAKANKKSSRSQTDVKSSEVKTGDAVRPDDRGFADQQRDPLGGKRNKRPQIGG